MYTDEQRVALKRYMAELDKSGNPQYVAQIELGMTQGKDYEELLLIGYVPTGPPIVKPETGIDPASVTPPPRTGKGATSAAWRVFALEVTELDEEVLDSFSRADIIGILEDRGVIPYQEL